MADRTADIEKLAKWEGSYTSTLKNGAVLVTLQVGSDADSGTIFDPFAVGWDGKPLPAAHRDGAMLLARAKELDTKAEFISALRVILYDSEEPRTRNADDWDWLFLGGTPTQIADAVLAMLREQEATK